MLMEKFKNIGAKKYIDIVLFLILFLVPFFTSNFKTELVGRFIVYMIFAISLDILWGSAGLMNLGHAIFFGIGGYIMAISLASQEGVPVFMQSFGLTRLPGVLRILESPIIAFFMGLIVPMIVALLLGYFIFTSKVKGVFFNIITLAFAALFELFVNNQQKYTGGANGISGITNIKIGGEPLSITQLYYLVFGILILVYLFCIWLTKSRFGLIIKSVRENEARLQFLGFNPAAFKMVIFAISGMIAGLAGMLYIPMNSFISPDKVGVMLSTSVLVWLAVGGKGNITGAMVGALIINILESSLSDSFGELWQLVLGVIMLVVVVFFPKGIIGTLIDFDIKLKARKNVLKAGEGYGIFRTTRFNR
ncbi:ribose transport system permease protein RbsC [Clostridium homopropionicum DSM 5847]|uniref:Ribose transport system permease protein RbsC n=2 Tax=Clostridium TaxID=1485 RepID=A0A0L6ZAU2_9CLOT|nr:urea ABC transporter permease subunit UrtC [Clostridium homopropionicum]KOA20085.1 ribose transport system permease protein RbsC [Clostridium homopropionicum DSM 5847]SFG86252.1 urea ABC transporter membrane protein [Clostridium homopropionicum]